jgi:hypothetical protein
MRPAGEKGFCLKIKIMKSAKLLSLMAVAIFLMAAACRKNDDKKRVTASVETSTDTAGLMLIGKDIITEVVLKPDTLGDPWDVEKVKGFKGEGMFKMIFDRIYNDKLTVYDCRIEKALTIKEIKNLEKEFNADLSKIGKVQFKEDWYFDTKNSFIVKKIKSVSFGFALDGFPDGPFKYKALFRIKN